MFRVLFFWVYLLHVGERGQNETHLRHEELAFLGEGEAGIRVEGCVRDDASAKTGIRGSRDHRGVVGGKRTAWKKHFDARGFPALFKRHAQLAVRGHATGN